MRKFLLAAAAALALAGCTPTISHDWDVDPSDPVGETIVDTVSIPATQALIVAHNAYQGVASAFLVYAQSGMMTPEQATRIRALNDEALSLLEGVGTGLSEAQRAARVFDIVAEINSIVRR